MSVTINISSDGWILSFACQQQIKWENKDVCGRGLSPQSFYNITFPNHDQYCIILPATSLLLALPSPCIMIIMIINIIIMTIIIMINAVSSLQPPRYCQRCPPRPPSQFSNSLHRPENQNIQHYTLYSIIYRCVSAYICTGYLYNTLPGHLHCSPIPFSGLNIAQHQIYTLLYCIRVFVHISVQSQFY